jgi:uncharacterized membrane protein
LATLVMYVSLVMGAFIAYVNNDQGSSCSDSIVSWFTNPFYFTLFFIETH